MDELWTCEICGYKYDNEPDLLAHQFETDCEREIKKRNKAVELLLEFVELHKQIEVLSKEISYLTIKKQKLRQEVTNLQLPEFVCFTTPEGETYHIHIDVDGDHWHEITKYDKVI